jgi:hypothetical protein
MLQVLQWVGTAFILGMYAVMNFYRAAYPLDVIFGLAGAVCFFIWATAVRNRPQMVINAVAITVCCVGLFTAAVGRG